MFNLIGAGSEGGWPSHFEDLVNQAIGALTVRNRSTVEEASSALDEMAAATGLPVRIVAAEIVGSTRSKDADRARRPPLVMAQPEVDIEALVDDVWWPGYLYLRDWHQTPQNRWVCFVRYNTRSSDGRIQHRARHFDEDHIRAAEVPAQRARPE
jgi:hypothetical protein